MSTLYHNGQPSPTKRCNICGQEKFIHEMQKHPTCKDGYRPRCKACDNAYHRANQRHKREARQQEASLHDRAGQQKKQKRAQEQACKHQLRQEAEQARIQQCRVCGVELTPENGIKNRRPGLYRPDCKSCYNKRKREVNPPSRYRKRVEGYCAACGIAYSPELFTLRNKGKPLVDCDACHNAYKRAQRAANLERVREQEMASYHRTDRNGKAKQKRRAQGIQPPYRVPAEDTRSYRRRFHDAHPDYNAAQKAKRRARMYETAADPVDYDAILLRDGWFCCICFLPIDPSVPRTKPAGLHFDHDIPLSRKGPHTASNIHPSHCLCNIRKRKRTLAELTPHDRRGPYIR